MNQTLVLIKPDGVQRSLIGTIIHRLEAKGLQINALKMLSVSDELANRHYEAHKGKPFFPGLVAFITSSPVVALVVQGNNAIEIVRNAMGTTNPIEAEQGTIRGDFAIDIGRNLVHGSDSAEAAEREISLFFNPEEIVQYNRDVSSWVIES